MKLIVRITTLFKTMAQVGLAVGALVLYGLYTYQSSLIYPASLNDGHGHCATPDEHDMDFETVHLKTKDGETLHCYLLKHDRNQRDYTNKTVVMLSPNAGNIGHALPLVAMFYKNLNCNVFIYSYRGYGKSTGKPSEVGLKLDADRVVDYLRSDSQYSSSHIVLYGRSLGGAVAIYIASRYGYYISGMILENTFLSIRKTVPHIFPFLKIFANFVHQKWDLEKLVPKIPASVPALLLSARNDEIVPPPHMDRIFSLLRSDNKLMYKFDSLHNDTVIQAGYWDHIEEFLERIG